MPDVAPSPEAGQRTRIRLMAVGAILLTLLALVIATAPGWYGDTPGKPVPTAQKRSASAPPPVEPVALRELTPETARDTNAAVPFSKEPNPSARPFHFKGDLAALSRATDCLAAAMLYEAGDDAEGERAVGQVVLNRLRHPAFPKSVCAVVFQGAERSTGCQFTFTCDGAMTRAPSPSVWTRARRLASAMLDGDVYRPVGYATHYHTDWVVPYWSATLDKVTAVDTHLFFRWPGWWGTPGAFQRQVSTDEPRITKLAALSLDHQPEGEIQASLNVPGVAIPTSSLANDDGAPISFDKGKLGQRVAGAKLLALDPASNGFAVLLDRTTTATDYERIAARYCAGRTQCRLMGWTDARHAPRAFPPDEASVAAMSYAYLRVKETGLERSLYNCREFPAAPVGQCMRQRIIDDSANPGALEPRPRHEVVKLRAPLPAADPPSLSSGPAGNL